jgi:hypothetical protein
MKHLLFVLLLNTHLLSAQEVFSSKTYIQTSYHDRPCFSLNNSSFVFYSPDNNEFIIKVDFSKFRTGNDSLDDWLDDLDDTKLIFRGLLNTKNLLDLSHHNSKDLLVNGVMSFNGVSQPHTIQLTLFEVSREGNLFINNQNNYFDRINANLQFGFYPKEFKVQKKLHHLKKKITLTIYRGYVNPFKPGMEHLLAD